MNSIWPVEYRIDLRSDGYNMNDSYTYILKIDRYLSIGPKVKIQMFQYLYLSMATVHTVNRFGSLTVLEIFYSTVIVL